MPRRNFVNIVAIVDSGNPDLNKALNAMKENIELLCGLRGGAEDHAVIKGEITTAYPTEPASASLNELMLLRETVRKLMIELKGEG